MNQRYSNFRWRSWLRSVPTLPVFLTLLLAPSMICAGHNVDWCELMAKRSYRTIVEHRVGRIRPVRRDSPVRFLNISDEEAREVESAAAEVAGTQWISIGAVVTGCPCEDGDKCTDQVWVQTHKDQGAIGLLLSKVDGHWQIGYVQRWWLRYERLQDEQYRMKSFDERMKLELQSEQLLDDFPSCGLDKKELAYLRDQEMPSCLRNGG